jgi:hypothetical protein
MHCEHLRLQFVVFVALTTLPSIKGLGFALAAGPMPAAGKLATALSGTALCCEGDESDVAESAAATAEPSVGSR